MKDVGVVYLYRFAEGEYPVRRFIQSYREHSAGLAHDFHVIFKGFQDKSHLRHAQSLFVDIPTKAIVLADIGFDLGSYVQAAKAVGNKRLIFFNTFSQILTDDWLAHFSRALSLPGVGLAGATGSWHANTSSYEGALKALFYKIRRFPGERNKFNAELVPTPCGRCAIVRYDAISSLLLVIFIVLLSLVVTPTRISVQTHL